ncbi:hypothetical protein STANM337S_02390 [Streptomyces tanashiensis]
MTGAQTNQPSASLPASFRNSGPKTCWPVNRGPVKPSSFRARAASTAVERTPLWTYASMPESIISPMIER